MSEVPPTRRWFQFGLKSLFVVVTISAVWMGYQMNWIRQRHAMLAKHQALTLEMEAKASQPGRWISHAANYLLCTTTSGQLQKAPVAPLALRLLGEPGVPEVRLVFVVNDESLIHDFHDDEIERAKGLFPESVVGRTVHFFENRPSP